MGMSTQSCVCGWAQMMKGVPVGGWWLRLMQTWWHICAKTVTVDKQTLFFRKPYC